MPSPHVSPSITSFARVECSVSSNSPAPRIRSQKNSRWAIAGRPSLAYPPSRRSRSTRFTFSSPVHHPRVNLISAFPSRTANASALPTRNRLVPFTFFSQLHHPAPLFQENDGDHLSLAHGGSGAGRAAYHSLPEPKRGTLLLSMAAHHRPMRGKEVAMAASSIFQSAGDWLQVVTLTWNNAMPPFSAWVL